MNKEYYIITGANGSIGQALTEAIAAQGQPVIMACRNLAKSQPVQHAHHRKDGQYRHHPCCRSTSPRLPRIISFAEHLSQESISIQALLNNAGVMNQHYSQTADGFESTIGVNYIGTVLLTRMLLPLMHPGSRIVTTTSLTRYIGQIRRYLLRGTAAQVHNGSRHTASRNSPSPSIYRTPGPGASPAGHLGQCRRPGRSRHRHDHHALVGRPRWPTGSSAPFISTPARGSVRSPLCRHRPRSLWRHRRNIQKAETHPHSSPGRSSAQGPVAIRGDREKNHRSPRQAAYKRSQNIKLQNTCIFLLTQTSDYTDSIGPITPAIRGVTII